MLGAFLHMREFKMVLTQKRSFCNKFKGRNWFFQNDKSIKQTANNF